MTSWHKTGAHPFYIGMYIHIYTHIYVHIYTSQKECLHIFRWFFSFQRLWWQSYGLWCFRPPSLTSGRQSCPLDASSHWVAEVSAELPNVFAEELTRHKLTKTAWSRLLSPLKEVQRIHGRLQPEDEVPEGESPAAAHPVWSALAQACAFRTEWRQPVRRRRRINLFALEAALLAESRVFSEKPSSALFLKGLKPSIMEQGRFTL